MDDFAAEKDSIELAVRCVEQIRECLEMARDKVEVDPEGARCLLRPAARLSSELLAVQAAIEQLAQHVHHPAELGARRK